MRIKQNKHGKHRYQVAKDAKKFTFEEQRSELSDRFSFVRFVFEILRIVLTTVFVKYNAT